MILSEDIWGTFAAGTEQAYDQKELPGAGPCKGENTEGLWLRSISRSAHLSPALPLSCFPVQVLPSHPLQPSPLCSSDLWDHFFSLLMLHRAMPWWDSCSPSTGGRSKTVGNRTEGILSRGPEKPSVKPTLLSGNSFSMCLCNS